MLRKKRLHALGEPRTEVSPDVLSSIESESEFASSFDLSESIKEPLVKGSRRAPTLQPSHSYERRRE